MEPFVNSSELSSGEASRKMSNEEYIRKHNLTLYLKDATKLMMAAGEERRARPTDFLAAYFTACCAGLHVTGRNYAFVSGSLFNRLHFVRNAVDTLAHMDDLVPGVKLMDCHSLLLLLCDDFPLNVVRAAFKPAAFLSQGLTNLEDGDALVPLLDFLKCLGITFIYERFLVETRHDAFDARSKYHVHVESVKEVMREVGVMVEEAGWGAPPPHIMTPLLERAVDSKKSLSFDMLVRSMCGSDELWESIVAEGERLHRAGEAATAMAKAATESRALRGAGDEAEGEVEGGRRSEEAQLPDYFLKKPPRKRSAKTRGPSNSVATPAGAEEQEAQRNCDDSGRDWKGRTK